MTEVYEYKWDTMTEIRFSEESKLVEKINLRSSTKHEKSLSLEEVLFLYSLLVLLPHLHLFPLPSWPIIRIDLRLQKVPQPRRVFVVTEGLYWWLPF